MKVAKYYSNERVILEEMPRPEIEDDELLVKVHSCGICGSDVMEWYRRKKAPLVLGHEMTGEIVETGDRVKDYEEGQRVFVSHHVPCGECRYCRSGHTSVCDTLRSTNYDPGGFAEYVRIPAINVEKGIYELPGEMSYEEGVFIEPLGCVIRSQGFIDSEEADSIVVIGSGISGMLHIKLAKQRGVDNIIAVDINEYKMEAAERMGADEVLHAEEVSKGRVKALNDGYPARSVIVTAGSLSAMEQAIDVVDRGGRILFFAPLKPEERLPTPIWKLWKNEISMFTSYAAGDDDICEAIDLIASGEIKVKDMITHRLPLEDAEYGFKLTAEGKGSIKVILEP